MVVGKLFELSFFMTPDGSRVLIADGDAGLRRRLYKLLLDADVFSDPVADGKEALATLQEKQYSVVLLDPALPQAGAAEQILQVISSLPTEQRPVVLVLAAGNVARSFDVDLVQVVLRKPCDVLQLAEIVSSCVRVSAEHPRSTSQTSRLTAADNSSA